MSKTVYRDSQGKVVNCAVAILQHTFWGYGNSRSWQLVVFILGRRIWGGGASNWDNLYIISNYPHKTQEEEGEDSNSIPYFIGVYRSTFL